MLDRKKTGERLATSITQGDSKDGDTENHSKKKKGTLQGHIKGKENSQCGAQNADRSDSRLFYHGWELGSPVDPPG